MTESIMPDTTDDLARKFMLVSDFVDQLGFAEKMASFEASLVQRLGVAMARAAQLDRIWSPSPDAIQAANALFDLRWPDMSCTRH
jgi:hypothetical protein